MPFSPRAFVFVIKNSPKAEKQGGRISFRSDTVKKLSYGTHQNVDPNTESLIKCK